MITQLGVLFLVWLVYFAVHSATASLTAKQFVNTRWPGAARYYRLAYNAFSALTLLPPLYLLWIWRTEPVIAWSGWAFWIAQLAAAIAIVLFYLSTRYYDMGAFLGTRAAQSSPEDAATPETFCLSPFHRFVRHPWYFFGLVVLWTRNMDAMQLLSTVAATAYLVMGSKLEEQKLIQEFGEVYARYRERVPGLVPLPGKYLKKEDII